MDTPALIACCLLPAAGCAADSTTDFWARRLLHRSGVTGKARLAMAGTAQDLLASGRIDAHRRVAVDDGVELDVWLLRSRRPDGDCNGTVLILHGLWDSKAHFLALGERLAEMGYDVVLPDLRAHGRSTGENVTYGAREKHDCRTLLARLRAAGDAREPFYAFGVSMGAATAVLYAATDPACRGVVAVAPYRDARAVCRRVVPLMGDAQYDALWARAAELADFDPVEACTAAAAAKLECPLTVVHGRADWLVPFSHGRAVYEAAPEPKRFIEVPWAGHFSILLARRNWFADRIAELRQGAGAHPRGSHTPGSSR